MEISIPIQLHGLKYVIKKDGGTDCSLVASPSFKIGVKDTWG